MVVERGGDGGGHFVCFWNDTAWRARTNISVTSAVRLKITLLLRVERLRMISTRVVSGVVPVVSVFSQASLCLSPWASIEYSGVWEAMGSG